MKITRGITKEFAETFKENKLYELYKNHQDDLFLGIRNNYISIYYQSASICKVTVDSRGNLKCKVANKYIGKQPFSKNRTSENGKTWKTVEYSSVTADDIIADYDCIKENIHSKDEKIAQQYLINKNNGNPESKWFCIDIEYVRQREDASGTVYGRFDIIAVSKTKPHRVALIELKYGNKSIGSSSGILKHAKDFIAFIDDKEYEKHLKIEILDIIKSMEMLGICPDSLKGGGQFRDEPEIFFITLDNKEDQARQTMRRYVLEGTKRSSVRTVEKECGIDITKQNNKRFTPTFLFSAEKVGGINISDIIDDKSYIRGLV